MRRGLLAGLSIGLLALGGQGAEAQAYRWVDDNGVVHYSDRVPPEEAKHRRTQLSPQGRELRVIEGAKSPEQLRKEEQLRKLRAEQERILTEQHDRDVSLLRTYRSEDEMYLALQGKLNTLDTVIKITETNRQRQREILSSQEKRAADFERKGQAVPKSVLEAMEATRRQIAAYEDKIRSVEEEKAKLTEDFSKDMARFRALVSQSPNLAAGSRPKAPGPASSSSSDEVLISAVACRPGPVCDRAWELARAFVRRHSRGELAVETERILQTPAPDSDQELGLTVTRIAGKGEDLLFLDLRCRNSSVGEEVCVGPRARELRLGFKTHLETGLGNAVSEGAGSPPPANR